MYNKKSGKTLGLALIKDENNLYRFSFTSDKKYLDNYKKQFFDMVYSFGRVNSNPSILNIEPPKIRVLKNSPKEGFVENVIKKSSLQKRFSEDIFITINGMDNLKTIQKIKTIYWFNNSSNLTLATFFSRFWTAAYSLLNLFNAVK